MSGAAVTGTLSELVAALRATGVRAGVGELVTAHRALAAIDPASPEDARFALRAVLCARREDLAAFDAAFDAILAGAARAGGEVTAPLLDPVAIEALPRVAAPTGRPADELAHRHEPVPAAWSTIEVLRDKDFAELDDAEIAIADQVIARLARRGPSRRSRRMRHTRRRAHVPDLRRTVRASLRHGGEPFERHWRAPSERLRPLVLVLDVSGSMAPYARMLVQYVHACVAARRRVEAFAFGTRLTRITRELAGREHDLALRRAAGAVADWSGGTRIGASLAELNRAHGRRLGRGAVVVILSDGWDRGEPELLAAEMARLRRSAHRVVWLNPLAAHDGWAPLTRGMRAAVPYTDHLLPGNSLASLEALAEILEEL